MSDPKDNEMADDASEQSQSPLRLRRDDPAPPVGPPDPNRDDAEEAGGGEGEGEAPKAPVAPSPVKSALKVLVAIVVLLLGFKFGFGPLISHARGLKTVVIVKNGSETKYQLRLGWRMLQAQLYPMSVAQFELDVGMPEKQGLMIKPLEPAGNAVKIRVPMKPGGATLVNLDKAETYHFYNPEAITTREIAGRDAVTSQIAAKQGPDAAATVVDAAAALGDEAHLEARQDQFIELTDYRVRGAIGYHQALNKEEGTDKQVITNLPMDLKAANGAFKFDPANPTVCDVQTTLGSAITVQVSESYAVQLPESARLNVRRSAGGNLNVDLFTNGVKLKQEGHEFVGGWRYQAYKAGTENWVWSWRYEGRTADNKWRFDVIVDKDGDQEEKVTNIEQRR